MFCFVVSDIKMKSSAISLAKGKKAVISEINKLGGHVHLLGLAGLYYE